MKCPYCDESHPIGTKLCPNTANLMPTVDRVERQQSRQFSSSVLDANATSSGDPFACDVQGLQVVTPWGAAVVLSNGDLLKIGRDTKSPWSSQLNSHISRNHAEMGMEAGVLFVIDEDSLNGTYVNGARLVPKERFVVGPGDVVELGKENPCVLHIQSVVE
jgi:hypothetical protein